MSRWRCRETLRFWHLSISCYASFGIEQFSRALSVYFSPAFWVKYWYKFGINYLAKTAHWVNISRHFVIMLMRRLYTSLRRWFPVSFISVALQHHNCDHNSVCAIIYANLSVRGNVSQIATQIGERMYFESSSFTPARERLTIVNDRFARSLRKLLSAKHREVAASFHK